MRAILVTGAAGFLGGGVANRLAFCGDFDVSVSSRRRIDALSADLQQFVVPSLDSLTSWQDALKRRDVVVHCAARVHLVNEHIGSLADFRNVNVQGTLSLARQAANAGVRRFVFISSIKVNGEATEEGRPFRSDDIPSPIDPYGISKLEAEQGLMAIAADTGIEVVIIRPVLIYGPGVKANFLSMMNWLNKGVPLPLGAIHNKRSLVSLDNVVDLIVTCIDHPFAANQTFLVSDGEDLSTTELLRRMGQALKKPARLFPVPASLLQAGATVLGKREMAQRLCSSLQVDISETKQLLGWEPPVTVDEGLRSTAARFLGWE